MTSWERTSNAKYYIGIGIIITIFIVLITWLYSNEKTVNPSTFCLESPTATNTTFAFLIDTTDSFSETQQEKVKKRIQSVINASNAYDRFQIYVINNAKNELIVPIFDLCMPSSDALTPPVIAKLNLIEFKKQLERAFEINFGNKTSPIIQSIDLVATRLPNDSTTKVLTVVSDFFENSHIFSHYRENWRKDIESNRPRLTAMTPALDGIEIHMLVIAREELNQGSEFLEWWLDFLEKSGATMTTRSIENRSKGTKAEFVIVERITG